MKMDYLTCLKSLFRQLGIFWTKVVGNKSSPLLLTLNVQILYCQESKMLLVKFRDRTVIRLNAVVHFCSKF
jgi:hypothetical protein